MELSELIATLRTIESNGAQNDASFAASLLSFRNRTGRLTERQEASALRMCARYATPRPAVASETPASAPRIDLAPLTRMFRAALEAGLQKPKIRIGSLTLKLAPSTGAHPGAVYVKRGKEYCGAILADGSTRYKPYMLSETERAQIEQFASDPLASASAYGHRTGHCCFCARELTDGRSVAMGYGPICAEKFGLEWGVKRAASTMMVAA